MQRLVGVRVASKGLRAAGITAAALVTVLLLAFLLTAATATQLTDRLAAATGAATALLALVAGTSAVQNAQLISAAREQARESSELVEAAAQQAEASTAQSKATLALVDEARADREFEYRPLLTFVVSSQGSVGGRPYRHLTVTNIGRGPAISAAIATHDFVDQGHLFGSSDMFDLGPGASRAFEVYDQVGASGQAFRRLIDDLHEPTLAIGFMDVVGNRYRVATSAGFRRPVETRHHDSPQQLDWAAWT